MNASLMFVFTGNFFYRNRTIKTFKIFLYSCGGKDTSKDSFKVSC